MILEAESYGAFLPNRYRYHGLDEAPVRDLGTVISANEVQYDDDLCLPATLLLHKRPKNQYLRSIVAKLSTDQSLRTAA